MSYPGGHRTGQRAKAILDRGELVPDVLVNELMIDQLGKPAAERGFILDGYPRTLGQAEALEGFLKSRNEKLNAALYFKTTAQVVVDRLSGRWSCPRCGANYHARNIPPRVTGMCDHCHKDLIQRSDDQPESVRRRLEVYEKETLPLLDYYRKRGLLEEVPGDLDVAKLEEVLDGILKECRRPAR